MTDTVVVPVTEAHDRLSELVSMVQKGATVLISKRGTVAAKLVPPEVNIVKHGYGPDIVALLETQIAARSGRRRTTSQILEGIKEEREAWN